jgi:polyisoprenoid-binding protein YceI
MTSRAAGLAAFALTALTVLPLRPAHAQGVVPAQAVAARASTRPPATGTRWVVDPVHSQLDFHVRHLVGSVDGTFTDWYGVIVTDDRDWIHGTVNVSAQTASLTTGNRYRDADLRGNRFFAADSFPQLTFESTGIVATDSTVEIGGILTIKRHSEHVTLSGEYRGIAKDAAGKERIAFAATTRINRKDFGIRYDEFVGSNAVVGDWVDITIAIEAQRAN